MLPYTHYPAWAIEPFHRREIRGADRSRTQKGQAAPLDSGSWLLPGKQRLSTPRMGRCLRDEVHSRYAQR